MAQQTQNGQRSQIGYGSVYRKGSMADTGDKAIRTVLGGQVWMVQPEHYAKTNNPCIWMQAGVIKFKSCNNFADCTTCKYDQAMRRQVTAGKQISWQDAMRRRPAMARLCRHSLTNRIEARVCAYDYQCGHCDFDQYFEDVLTPKTANVPFETQTIKGFAVPMDYHFHAGHTWARVESGGYIRVGMDDFVMKLLGEADGFDLPLIGKEFDPGAIGWGLKRKDKDADVRSPVGGIIVEVNSQVRENPARANHDPYSEGWLFMVKTNDVKQSMKQLMTENSTIEWMDGEITCLENMIQDVAGPLAADGGMLANDIYGNLPTLGWDNLTHRFLGT